MISVSFVFLRLLVMLLGHAKVAQKFRIHLQQD